MKTQNNTRTKSWQDISEQVARLEKHYENTRKGSYLDDDFDIDADIKRYNMFVHNVNKIALRYYYNLWTAYSFGVMGNSSSRLTREKYTVQPVEDNTVRIGDKVAYLQKFGMKWADEEVKGLMYAKVLDVFDNGDIRTDWNGILSDGEYIKVGTYNE